MGEAVEVEVEGVEAGALVAALCFVPDEGRAVVAEGAGMGLEVALYEGCDFLGFESRVDKGIWIVALLCKAVMRRDEGGDGQNEMLRWRSADGIVPLGQSSRDAGTARRSISLWEPALPRARLPKRMICSGSNFWAIN